MSQLTNSTDDKRNTSGSAGSLVEALQALCAKMSKAASELEAEEGLKELRAIRTGFLGGHNDAAEAARRDAEALIAWVELRLEQLRRQLARKRRAQEGEVMEKLAKQREAEGPSLLPTELIEAVVRSTTEAEKDESAAQTPKPTPARKKQSPTKAEPEKKPELRRPVKKPAETPEPAEPAAKENAAKAPTPPEQKPEAPEAAAEEKRSAPTEPLRKKIDRPRPAPAQRPEWTKSERLAAHLAASLREDLRFFEKLRKAAGRNGPMQKAPEDEGAAERRDRTIHGLNRRLVNLELHARALARAEQTREPVSPLLRTAAKELTRFMREFKAAKEALPEMPGEIERRFGGWAELFAAMKPEKGGSLLAKCRTERESAPQAAPERPATVKAAEAEAPQLVLKRDDPWDQTT